MTYISVPIILLFSILAFSSKSYSQGDISIPDGPYLGQTPPGSTPEIFAPGIVNTEEFIEIEGMFGADMNTFYFVRRDEKEVYSLNVIEYKNNQWQKSIVKQGGASHLSLPMARPSILPIIILSAPATVGRS